MADSRIVGVQFPRVLVFFATAAAAISTLAGNLCPARADVTVESLTSTAVTGVGPYYQDVEDALRRFATKDYTGALARLERAKKNVPRLAPAEVMMSQIYFDSNMVPQAIGSLEKAIQTHPQDPEAYVILGERAVSEGRLTEAEMLFQRASKTLEPFAENPKRKQNLQVRSYAGWASVDESRGNWKEARAKLEALIKLEPQSAVAHDKLARALFALDDHKAAYGEFRAAVEADKSLPSAEISMALLFKDSVNSEKWVKAAVAKGAQDLGTQMGAARYYLKTNQLKEARVHAEAAVKLDPDGAESNLTIGLIARLLADYKTAVAHLSKAHLLAPANTIIINNLALALIEMPDEVNRLRAFQFADLNARQNPNNPEMVATFGWVNYRLNRKPEAERALSAVLNAMRTGAIKSGNSDMGFYLANIAKDRGQTTEAVRLLKESLNSNEPFAYRKAAQAMLAQLSKSEKSSAKPDVSPAASKSAGPATKADATK